MCSIHTGESTQIIHVQRCVFSQTKYLCNQHLSGNKEVPLLPLKIITIQTSISIEYFCLYLYFIYMVSCRIYSCVWYLLFGILCEIYPYFYTFIIVYNYRPFILIAFSIRCVAPCFQLCVSHLLLLSIWFVSSFDSYE